MDFTSTMSATGLVPLSGASFAPINNGADSAIRGLPHKAHPWTSDPGVFCFPLWGVPAQRVPGSLSSVRWDAYVERRVEVWLSQRSAA